MSFRLEYSRMQATTAKKLIDHTDQTAVLNLWKEDSVCGTAEYPLPPPSRPCFHLPCCPAALPMRARPPVLCLQVYLRLLGTNITIPSFLKHAASVPLYYRPQNSGTLVSLNAGVQLYSTCLSLKFSRTWLEVNSFVVDNTLIPTRLDWYH